MVSATEKKEQIDKIIEENKKPQMLLDISNERYLERIIVSFIDVGHGDCTLVTDGKTTMLIDAGSIKDGPLVADFLKNSGVERIDYLIGTHPDEEHIGGLKDIIENFNVQKLIMPKTSIQNEVLNAIESAADKKKIEIIHPSRGDRWNIGYSQCTVLSCAAVTDENNVDESSIVLHLDTKRYDYLFMSDAKLCNEEAIMKSGLNYKADVLRVADHGSAESNSEKFIRAVEPEYIVIATDDASAEYPNDEKLMMFHSVAKYTIMTNVCSFEIQQGTGREPLRYIHANCDGDID